MAFFNGIGQLLEEQEQVKSGASDSFPFQVVDFPAEAYSVKIASEERQVMRKVVVE